MPHIIIFTDLMAGTKCSSRNRLIEIQFEQRYLRSMLLLNELIFDFLCGCKIVLILMRYSLYLGLRRAVRRVHRSVHGRVFFVKIGTHTKFGLGDNPLGLFLLFGAN